MREQNTNPATYSTSQEWFLCTVTLNEDYAFCERARQCGHKIMVDTTVRLWHVGLYRYSWEDAGSDKDRFANYNFAVGAPDKPTT